MEFVNLTKQTSSTLISDNYALVGWRSFLREPIMIKARKGETKAKIPQPTLLRFCRLAILTTQMIDMIKNII